MSPEERAFRLEQAHKIEQTVAALNQLQDECLQPLVADLNSKTNCELGQLIEELPNGYYRVSVRSLLNERNSGFMRD